MVENKRLAVLEVCAERRRRESKQRGARRQLTVLQKRQGDGLERERFEQRQTEPRSSSSPSA